MLLATLWALLAEAQEGPGRVAYPSLVEGTVLLSDAAQPDGRHLPPNQPLAPGSRLQLSPGARLELSQGSSSWRAEGPAQIELSALDDLSSQTQLRRGRLDVRVRRFEAGERLEIDTPNLAVLVQQAGAYRFDVDPDSGQTRVTVTLGSLVAYGEQGQALTLPAGLQWTFQGRQLGQTGRPVVPRIDAFDQWTQGRQQLEEQSLSARYVPRDLIGYQQLDGWGEWHNDPSLGPVWYPQLNNPDWAPYRYGQWQWIEPWGWTWVDEAPWGFAPFHYGRWVVSSRGWGWVPGRYERRPSYSPALVGFIGQPQRGGPGHHRQPGVPWVPLAPGEHGRPGTPVGPRPGSTPPGRDRPGTDSGYAHQNRPGGMTQQPQSGGPGWQRPSGSVNDPIPMPKPFIQVQPGQAGQASPSPTRPSVGSEGGGPSLAPQPALSPPAQPWPRPNTSGQVTAVPNTAPRTEQERQERAQAQQREQLQRLQPNAVLLERQRQEQQQWQQHQWQLQQQQQLLQQQQQQQQQQWQWQRQQQAEQERQRQEAQQREQWQREQAQREQQLQVQQQLQRQQQERAQFERQQQERLQQERQHQAQQAPQLITQPPTFQQLRAPGAGREGGPGLRPQQGPGSAPVGTPVGPRPTPSAPNTQ